MNGTPTSNAISYTAGTLAGDGLVSIDEHEPIEFGNKTALTINAGGGQDEVSLNNATTPTGLSLITINGGNSSGDKLTVTGVNAAVTVDTGAGTILGATGAGGVVQITYADFELLNLLAGIGNLSITTTAADDTATVTPGVTLNSGTVQSNGTVPQISFQQ